MAKILALIEAGGIDNVRLYAGDAVDLLRLAAGRLARRRRSALSRSVAEAAALEAALRAGSTPLRMLARVLRPGGVFRFATDIPDYAAWTLERLARAPDFVWTAERADDWRHPWPGFRRNPLRGQGETRGPRAVLSGISPQHVNVTVAALPAAMGRDASRKPVRRVEPPRPRRRARSGRPARRSSATAARSSI